MTEKKTSGRRPESPSESPSRTAELERLTRETQIRVRLDLDGGFPSRIESGVPFLDHMLEQLARHGGLALDLSCKGDLEVDAHHSVEDCGIALGLAFARAVGEKKGIRRFAQSFVAMDETLASVVVDLSGRGFLRFEASFPSSRIGAYDTECTEDFFRAFAMNAGVCLHARVHYGRNSHHMIEALFKALARALSDALSADPRRRGSLPSTKGTLA